MGTLGSLVWTLMPNGRGTAADGTPTLRMSVMLSPRLAGPRERQSGQVIGDKLADYPLFAGGAGLGNWTTTAATLQFAVQFDGIPPLAAALDPRPLDPVLWTG